jgi:hypothetical protein
MAAYRFLKPYRSSFGQWSAGDTADFDDDTAAWLGRDEPGCLELVTEERELKSPPSDRMQRTRNDRGGGEGAMSKGDNTFKAVKA